MIEGDKAVAGEIDNLGHERRILSQAKEEPDHKNKSRSGAGGTRSPDAGRGADAGREGIPDVRRWEC